MNKNFLTIIISVFFFYSCQEVIDLKLDTQEKQLVIDAYIDWHKAQTTAIPVVHLSYTSDFYGHELSEPVSGAKITISTYDGQVYSLQEVKNPKDTKAISQQLPPAFYTHKGGSIYICKENFIPKLGKDYILNIDYNGNKYTSKARMREVPSIDPQRIIQKNNGGLFKDKTEIRFYFQGIPNQKNSYLVRIKEADKEMVLAFDDTFVANGKFFFNTSQFELELKKGDRIKPELYRVSSDYKEFVDFLRRSMGVNSRGQMGVIPTRVLGNIVNENNPNQNPLGAFRVSQYTDIEYIVK